MEMTTPEKKKNKSNEPMSTHFHAEILMDVLNRLSVRSLLRFKSVSKFWETLITDPYFIMKHLNRAKHDKNSHKLLVSDLKPNGITPLGCSPLSSFQLLKDQQKIDYPTSFIPWYCTLKCSCDGLVIIRVVDNVIDKRSIHLLWNPSTRESIVLSNPKTPLTGSISRMGLGYDSTSGDYKILQIDSNVRGPRASSQILALKSDRWRNIDKHPLAICNLLNRTFSLAMVHEAFHWIIIIGDYNVVKKRCSLVSFNISNEVYGEIPLPKLDTRRTTNCGVSILKGLLCVYSTTYPPAEKRLTIWVMRDYGVKESWNVLLTTVDPLICLLQLNYWFADGTVLFWCAHHVPSSECVSCHHAIAFTEILISPKSLTYY